uniref:Uncharacterized protein n=1 Tax=Arundo donax TaxID=35708 RepID=A0A0A9CNT9_ARUDO
MFRTASQTIICRIFHQLTGSDLNIQDHSLVVFSSLDINSEQSMT